MLVFSFQHKIWKNEEIGKNSVVSPEVYHPIPGQARDDTQFYIGFWLPHF